MNRRLNRAVFANVINVNWYVKCMETIRMFQSAVIVFFGVLVLAGCTQDGELSQRPLSGNGLSADARSFGNLVERDIEAPEVFQLTGLGVWDGRPSLGGVWVAHTSARSAERVIIRNVKSEKFVIGSLFHRDDVKDAPLFQISADAAQALGVLTGQPIKLEVTALRSQNASSNDVRQGQNPQSGVSATALVASEKIETTTSTEGLTKSFIQLGIFNVEQNAKNTATLVRQVGIVPLIKQQSKDGKPFWRVLIGPANSLQERAILLKTVKSVGFKDAYAVTH